MRSVFTVFLLAFGLSACVGAKPAPQGPPGLYGRVLGPGGVPMDDVRVTTEPSSSAVRTAGGKFVIQEGLKGDEDTPVSYTVLVYKLGWWGGEAAKPVVAQYAGGVLKLPDIRMYPIGAPEVELDAPSDGTEPEDRMGSGVVRDGE